ncbi:hypothetical protein PTKIN_Ptkin08bG0117500 [Pterospermum kingtungense]
MTSFVVLGSDYPTANLFLSQLWIIKELLDGKSQSEVLWLKVMAKKMQLKFDKYWGNCNLLISIVVVLDPRNKMTLIEFAFRVIYSENEAPKQITVVCNSLYELYELYMDEATADKSTENDLQASDVINKGFTASVVEKGKVVETGRSKFERYVRSVDTV